MNRHYPSRLSLHRLSLPALALLEIAATKETVRAIIHTVEEQP